jgi:hypothetical protein
MRVEPRARKAIDRFVRLLARAGCPAHSIQEEVAAACRRLPRSWPDPPDRDALDAGQVVTLWFSDPAYLDARGNPRALPLRGTTFSIEELARRIDPRLDVRDVFEYLDEAGALRRTGRGFVPRNRVLIFRGSDYMSPSLRGLFGLLSTLEHNRWFSSIAPRRLQLVTRNPRLPERAAEAFKRRARVLMSRLLVQLDADMHRRAQARRPGERTVEMGIGAYQFEEGPGPARRRGRVVSGRRRSARGGKR